jgi:hypothetical protein
LAGVCFISADVELVGSIEVVNESLHWEIAVLAFSNPHSSRADRRRR